MNWGQSYSASWRVFRVNRDTWADAEVISNVDSASVTRTADGSLLESGEFTVTGELEPDYYRLVMTAEQGGDIERVDVATMLFDVNGGEFNYNRTSQTAEGYSVLYPASRTVIIAGEYAPAGVDGAEYAADLLRGAINAPVLVEGSFTLNDNVVHEIGSYVIDAVWAVLEAGDFVIQIDGRGIVHIRQKPEEPSLILDTGGMRLLTPGIRYTTDISEIPNRYIAIDDFVRAVAVNDDPASAVSTVSRGYYVDYVDESPVPINGETMGAYVRRKLKELSVMKDEREYTREYSPDVLLYSLIRASIDGLQGDLRVQSQNLTCGAGITVAEKAIREVTLW